MRNTNGRRRIHDLHKAGPLNVTEEFDYHHYNAVNNDGDPTALQLAISKDNIRISLFPQHVWDPVLKDKQVDWKLVGIHGDAQLAERKYYDFNSGAYYFRRVEVSGNVSDNTFVIGLVSGQSLVTVSALRYLPEKATRYALEYLETIVKYKVHSGSQGSVSKKSVCTDLKHAKQICAGEKWCKGFSFDYGEYARSKRASGNFEYARACIAFVDKFDVRTDETYSANFVSFEKLSAHPVGKALAPADFSEIFIGGFFLGAIASAWFPEAQALAAFGTAFGVPISVLGLRQLKHRISNYIQTRIIPARLKKRLRKYLPTLMNDGSKHLYKFIEKRPRVKKCSDQILVQKGSSCP